MIRTVFTIANKLVHRFRFSPTAIIEGREQTHLQGLVAQEQQYELQRQARKYEFEARINNIADPFQKEKEQIIYEFADEKSNLNYEQAWHRIDEIEQRQSESIWKAFYDHKAK